MILYLSLAVLYWVIAGGITLMLMGEDGKIAGDVRFSFLLGGFVVPAFLGYRLLKKLV